MPGDRAEAGEDEAEDQRPEGRQGEGRRAVEVVGTVTPFVGHQKVEVRLGNSGDTVIKADPTCAR